MLLMVPLIRKKRIGERGRQDRRWRVLESCIDKEYARQPTGGGAGGGGGFRVHISLLLRFILLASHPSRPSFVRPEHDLPRQSVRNRLAVNEGWRPCRPFISKMTTRFIPKRQLVYSKTTTRLFKNDNPFYSKTTARFIQKRQPVFYSKTTTRAVASSYLPLARATTRSARSIWKKTSKTKHEETAPRRERGTSSGSQNTDHCA